jgi:hypothetical protein
MPKRGSFFFIDLRAMCWQKGATALNLEKNWVYPFLHVLIKLEG